MEHPQRERHHHLLDELYEALDRFPDSPMAPAWQHEIERLKEQLTYAG